MLEGEHFQNGYITRDIDKAIAAFQTRAGIGSVRSFEASVQVRTPQGEGALVSRLAFIWVGKLQYELIQPVCGPNSVYCEALPADHSLRLHHICMRVPDWEGFRARVARARYPVVLEGGSELLKFLYLDAREFLGHYLEYTWMVPERWKAMGGP
ncbi:Glyoxalase/Bleomycin resistance protein/Dioxygenase superfamily protein [Solimonas aquatica]|uniref:Glyoxalase/Bleomycin resistance protein/Dioxygenase superfamily protein n=1 Tax=Solimonas aquatica TaxID=489703 RepID=A0A1H9G033_9GAMM|nr:VOC family protein [Solimonas aquatica]SEQ43088.1 Glyoxalase/Bleomycin resistance protein/Dioxygenase superfamily protein [Solimonas aquatica]